MFRSKPGSLCFLWDILKTIYVKEMTVLKYAPWVLTGLVLISVVWLAVTGTLGAGSQQGIGVIDMGRVVEQSRRAQDLNQQLNDYFEQMLADFEAERYLEEDERSAREKELYSDYLRLRQELEDQFQHEVDQIVVRIVNEKGLAVVVDQDVVRHGGFDISNQVIRALQ